jgi:hypothetical protein
MYKRVKDLNLQVLPELMQPRDNEVVWENAMPDTTPSIWGPSFWYVLHNAALKFPMKPSINAKTSMKKFIEVLPLLLPCSDCAEHAREFLRHVNLDHAVATRQNLFTFFWNFHNHVNTRNNQPQMPFAVAFNLYNRGPDSLK